MLDRRNLHIIHWFGEKIQMKTLMRWVRWIIGYVANSPYTVVGESYTAGRLYDKMGGIAKGTVLYVLPKGVLCVLKTDEKKLTRRNSYLFLM